MNNQQIEQLSLSIIGSTAARLPPPWSGRASVALKILSDLLGLFGGSSPSTAELIQQAVTELEGFWNQNQITNGQDSVNAFLSWCQENVNSNISIGTPADATYISTQLLVPLQNQFDSSLSDSGVSQLGLLSDPRFINPNICTSPSDNQALNVLVLCTSSLCSAKQMMLLLNAQLASFGMPNANTGPSTKSDDQNFQEYTASWLNILNSFDEFVNGSGKPIPTGASMQVTADCIGWAGAISQYLNQWLAYRTGQVQITSRVIHGVEIGWVFWVTDNCTGQQQASDLGWSKTEAEQWANNTRNNMISSFPGQLTGIQNVINGWTTMVSHWKSLQPMAQPSQSTIEINNWGPTAGSNSHWYGVEQVRYGVSFSNDNGPSLRSDWSGAWVSTGGNSNPTVSGLPTLEAGQGTRQIWRQFKVSGDKNSDPEGVPMIVHSGAGESSTYIDTSNLDL